MNHLCRYFYQKMLQCINFEIQEGFSSLEVDAYVRLFLILFFIFRNVHLSYTKYNLDMTLMLLIVLCKKNLWTWNFVSII